MGKAHRVAGNIWCVSAGNPSSHPVSDANSASLLKRLTNPQQCKSDVEQDGAPCVAAGS